MFFTGFVVGCLFGVIIGIAVLALCQAASDDPSTAEFEREAGLDAADSFEEDGAVLRMNYAPRALHVDWDGSERRGAPRVSLIAARVPVQISPADVELERVKKVN